MRKNTASFCESGNGKTEAEERQAPGARRPAASLSVARLARFAPGWILDGESRRLSPETIYGRRIVVEKLLWFLRDREYDECGVPELRAFLAYLSTGHTGEAGRWNNPHNSRPVKSGTVATYHRRLSTLFGFLVAEGALDVSPMDQVRSVVDRPDQISPFTPEQVQALLAAAKRSRNPKRNTAILLLLLDTGIRASELCGLRIRDMDLVGSRRLTVSGKGGKQRTLPMDRVTAKALWDYLRETDGDRDDDGPVFLGDRGLAAGEGLTRSGLLQIMERLGKAAKIELTRCSPHTMRHTFAVEFLRSGGNTFSLQTMLGHTSLAMTNRYVQLAQADIDNQHRQYSPVARMKGKAR